MTRPPRDGRWGGRGHGVRRETGLRPVGPTAHQVALPDVSVADTSVEERQAVFEPFRSSGRVWEYADGGVAGPLPSAAEVWARPADAERVELRVRPVPEVSVVFRPGSADVIDLDVDLRELPGQEGVDVLCGLLGSIGRRPGRPVLMTGEGDRGETRCSGVDPAADRVVPPADPGMFTCGPPRAGSERGVGSAAVRANASAARWRSEQK
ncbi:hypothetical protein ACWDRR_06325 [Kitasatospora sp. NPDC003701]